MKKINILISENEILKLNKEKENNLYNELIIKNNELEKEIDELKIIIKENNIKNDNLIKKYNEIKNNNNILLKENQELKKLEQNNKDIINLKNELNYKNSIIKYLEEILYNYNNKEKDEFLRDEYEKNKKK